MKPLKLALKGFAGIRAGLGKDELTLDLAAIAKDAELIAIAGKNGSGKSTLMDNLHPYRIMPSRASGLASAGFSFYDHLCLPESAKELIWEHDGEIYRSQLVFRQNGSRKTEAFLHRKVGDRWEAFVAADNTLSDGKTLTYDHCIESILGNSETFFTSVFNAQNRRPLASYANGEIKALMVELLGLEKIREAGEQAGNVQRQLSQVLEEKRSLLATFNAINETKGKWSAELVTCKMNLADVKMLEQAFQTKLDGKKVELALLSAQSEREASVVKERGRITSKIADSKSQSQLTLGRIQADTMLEQRRRDSLTTEMEREATARLRRHDAIKKMVVEHQSLVSMREAILNAIKVIPEWVQAETDESARLQELRAKLGRRSEMQTRLDALRSHLTGVLDAAGRAAALKEQFVHRCSLTDGVPCRGTDLQSQCHLLADARAASSLIPVEENRVSDLNAQAVVLQSEIEGVQHVVDGFGSLEDQIATQEYALSGVREHLHAATKLAHSNDQLASAEAALHDLSIESEEIEARWKERYASFETDCQAVDARLAELKTRLDTGTARATEEISALTNELNALPVPIGPQFVLNAQGEIAQIQTQLTELRAKQQMGLLRQGQLEASLAVHCTTTGDIEILAREIDAIGEEIAQWHLLTKALSNNGLIALCIDDAGPALSSLANELLFACYGARFSVSIQTQVETAKRELKEGFDITVFDSETQESKSVSVMSGGERVWINECLTRAIAIYLSRTSGRHYDTLFTDESDGPLDHERKQQYMQMKRKVRELGGYRAEYFITQSPALLQFADCIIDLDEFRATAQ